MASLMIAVRTHAIAALRAILLAPENIHIICRTDSVQRRSHLRVESGTCTAAGGPTRSFTSALFALLTRAPLALVFSVVCSWPTKANADWLCGDLHFYKTPAAACEAWFQALPASGLPDNVYTFAGIEFSQSPGGAIIGCEAWVFIPEANTTTFLSGQSCFAACTAGLAWDMFAPGGCSPINGTQPGKLIGTDTCNCGAASPGTTGALSAGEPIDVASGNMTYHFRDYTTSNDNRLYFERFYNSRSNYLGALGYQWRTNFDRYIYYSAYSPIVTVERPNGQRLEFALSNAGWTTDNDTDYTLVQSGGTWTLRTPDDTVEIYSNAVHRGDVALLVSIELRNGYTQTLTYGLSGPSGQQQEQLTSVHDSYNRSLMFSYNTDGTLASIATPDGTNIAYGYVGSIATKAVSSVTFPTLPPTTLSYVYDDSDFPNLLTGVLDESGNRYETWTYDSYGRGLTSQLGSGVNLTAVSFNDTDGTRTVTNALGNTDTYTFTVQQNVPKVTSISRAATGPTAKATEFFAYDSNGYLASITDWNGNTLTYANNSHGLPTTINEAAGSAVARNTTIEYDPLFVHSPSRITTSGLTSLFTYDATGNLLARTLVDTTATTKPYSTNGQSRTWTNTWANFLLASTTTPNNKTTTFDHDSSGTLVSITDALGHMTHVTAHTGGGLPQTVVDPNGVVTTLVYDTRQRLLSVSLSTSGGPLTTAYTYYLNGDVTTALPDGSLMTSLHDRAHRLIGYADTYDNQLDWTLDALGDAVAHVFFDPKGSIAFYRTATFDAMGRELTDTSTTTGKSWRYAYDHSGNTISIEDPLHHITARGFDALNQLTTITDANGSVVHYTYDAHDRPLTVTDKNGNTTTYVYDGFGESIQEVSPDSGTTVYYYDNDGNRIRKIDAAGVVSNSTFDALDRILTTVFPADPTQNIAYTYDETGTPTTFGIGRLTGVMDAAGSLTRGYDERGNLLTERRISGAEVLTTSYRYDKASRVASITYPSGAVSSYSRDAAGNVTQMPFMAANSDQTYSLASIARLPFGPVTYIHYNNGDNAEFVFDQDYRLTRLAYANDTYVTYLKLAYGYDAANNVTAIKDRINPGHSQAFGYDGLNRLTRARGPGTYGDLSWSYDKNGNVLSSQAGNITYASTYAPGANRLAAITWLANRETFAYTPTGNITLATLNSGREFTATYSAVNRLASVTGIQLPISNVIYDWRGRRFSKTNPGSISTLYIYGQDGSLLEESKAGKITDYIYLDGINVANWSPGEKHLYAIDFDRLGVPLVGRDEYGLTNWAAYSEPYGAMTVTRSSGEFTGPMTQNLRLPGQYFDSETGFHYNGARDYIPTLGRFLEADPTGLAGGLNNYLYANANPERFTDPTGRANAGMTGNVLENHVVRRLCDQYDLKEYDRQRLHYIISGQEYTPQEIEDIIQTEFK